MSVIKLSRRINVTGVDNVGNVTLTDGIGYFIAVFAYLFKYSGAYAVFLKEFCRTCGSLYIKAKVVETADKGKCFFLVLIRNGGKHGAVVLQVHTACLQRLIKCAVEVVIVTDSFTGGFHFGGKVCVYTVDLVKGEYGCFYVMTLLFVGINAENTLLLKAYTQNYLGCDIRKGISRCLGKEGNGTGGTGVNLDNIYVFVLINDKLNVKQTYNAYSQAQHLGITEYGSLNLIGNAVGGIYAYRVAGVDTRSFNQLHNTGNEYVYTVADSVNLYLFTLNIFINKYGLVFVYFNCALKILAELLLVCNDLHSSSAQNEGGTYQNGVAYFCGSLNAVLDIGYRLALRLGNIKLCKYFFKAVTVFGTLNSGAIRTDNVYASVNKGLCKVYCGLTAKGCDNTHRLFKLNNIHYVFGSKRLEVKLVCGGVVGGNGFGVVVNNNSLVAAVFNGGYGVNGRVIELNALTYTDRTCTQNNYLLSVGKDRFVLAGVGGVEIGDIRIGVAGIHHTVNGEYVFLFTLVEHFDFAYFPDNGYLLIAKAHLLCGFKGFYIPLVFLKAGFHIHNIFKGVKEVNVYLGEIT